MCLINTAVAALALAAAVAVAAAAAAALALAAAVAVAEAAAAALAAVVAVQCCCCCCSCCCCCCCCGCCCCCCCSCCSSSCCCCCSYSILPLFLPLLTLFVWSSVDLVPTRWRAIVTQQTLRAYFVQLIYFSAFLDDLILWKVSDSFWKVFVSIIRVCNWDCGCRESLLAFIVFPYTKLAQFFIKTLIRIRYCSCQVLPAVLLIARHK